MSVGVVVVVVAVVGDELLTYLSPDLFVDVVRSSQKFIWVGVA